MKIAVVGSGKLGQRHLSAWSKIEGIEIVGVIARNQERLEKVASEYGTKAFNSIDELVANTEVDVFDICTPTHTHAALVMEAANQKKHIICEKPLALTSEEAEDIIKVCAENNVQLLVAQTLRFFPEYVNAREQVKNGAIGKPGVMRLSRGVPYPAKDSWYTDESKSGGLFMDLGVHDLDWVLWTFGDVERVMAKRVQRSGLEYGFINLKMTDGTIAHVELSWAETKFKASFELTGDKGMITYDHDDSNPLVVQFRSDENAQIPRSIMEKDPYQRQLEHFVQCISGEAQPIVTAEDALKVIKVVEAAVKSAEEGQPVTLGKGGN
ncbi:Gfo/Idh/MocA family protein [Lederbergia wuyishanensis]|uniref:Dehydrogenase n=1 Tax=Lederbergia wuyishanensis TaxID=1347903 RepID=A0ABU0D408_9BACI|nr:Gfo/Idh/MocA family oxidoreductase [Lederbergia wuyishanensis]MCJ8008264.1 Gfo/Idh/MocA family oxidoreductase [Lederbergia wuyishanensis]MDQ0343146.1 putative dehydrogenase [Lederbergia wuyishanensis]